MRQPNPINIVQIDHVVLRVVDMTRMIDFYGDVLGCRLERGPDDNGLAQLRAGTSLIDLVDVAKPLGQQLGGAPDPNARNLDHVCLQLEPWDATAIRAYLERHDVKVGEVADRYGARGMGPSIYIEDPEGNTVELKGSAAARP